MKPVLIDDLIVESHAQCEINRQLMGVRVRGWKIAKPLNYNFNFFEKIQLSLHIFRGKAIAVRFFEDLTEKDKDDHIKKNLKK